MRSLCCICCLNRWERIQMPKYRLIQLSQRLTSDDSTSNVARSLTNGFAGLRRSTFGKSQKSQASHHNSKYAHVDLHMAVLPVRLGGSSPIKAIGGAVIVKNVFRFGAGSLVKREHDSSSGDRSRPPPASSADPVAARRANAVERGQRRAIAFSKSRGGLSCRCNARPAQSDTTVDTSASCR